MNSSPVKTKVAFVLIDGVGDVNIPQLGNKTPLQYAHHPILDAIASAGYNGLIDPVEPGLACGSDTAHMSLFGYDPRALYRGRGAYESMGAGLDMQPGDIAFKSNFATLDPSTGIVIQRRADRQFEVEGPILCAALDNIAIPGYPDYSINVKYATEHRCGVVIRGPMLTDAIAGTDPLKDNLPLLSAQPIDNQSHEAVLTAHVVNAASEAIRNVLEHHPINIERKNKGKHPANVVLLRGCGCRLALTPFHEQHGMKAAIVSPTKIIAGLGMCAGMDVLNVPGTTGDYRTLFHKKSEAIAHALIGSSSDNMNDNNTNNNSDNNDGYDFAFLHVKAVDDAGHDGSVEKKVAYINVVDTMIGQLLRRLWHHEQLINTTTNTTNIKYTIVVTGDHSTPVEFTDHSHEPVPFAIAHVCDVVQCMGGSTVLEKMIPSLDEIPHPSSSPLSSLHNNNNSISMNGNNGLSVLSSIMGMNGNDSNNTNGTTNTTNSIRSGDSVYRFSEIDAVRGALGRFPGSQVMPLIRRYTGRSK